MTTIDPSDTKLAYYKLRPLDKSWGQEMINILLKYGEMNVSEVVQEYRDRYGPILQPDISERLVRMGKANILTRRREGKWIYYSLNYKEIERINDIASKLAAMYNPKPINPLKQHSLT